MAFNFVSKKILVTGAGRGLGRDIAIKLAECGADVFAVSRTATTLKTLKDEHSSIETITLDLSNWEETRRVLKQLDTMDGLVNNAAVIPTEPYVALETSYKDVEKYIHNNVYGTLNCTQIFAKKMISADKNGSIVNVSSNVAYKAFRGVFPYCVSKSAMEMVTKQFAMELGAHGIRVNAVLPTLFMTDTIRELEDNSPLVNTVLSRIPMNRLPETTEIVGTVLYLLSEHSAMVSGVSLLVDGANNASLTL